MDAIKTKMIQKLIDVGTGKVMHIYRGQCPEPVAGQQTRDSGCPACKALDAAEKMISTKS